MIIVLISSQMVLADDDGPCEGDFCVEMRESQMRAGIHVTAGQLRAAGIDVPPHYPDQIQMTGNGVHPALHNRIIQSDYEGSIIAYVQDYPGGMPISAGGDAPGMAAEDAPDWIPINNLPALANHEWETAHPVQAFARSLLSVGVVDNIVDQGTFEAMTLGYDPNNWAYEGIQTEAEVDHTLASVNSEFAVALGAEEVSGAQWAWGAVTTAIAIAAIPLAASGQVFARGGTYAVQGGRRALGSARYVDELMEATYHADDMAEIAARYGDDALQYVDDVGHGLGRAGGVPGATSQLARGGEILVEEGLEHVVAPFVVTQVQSGGSAMISFLERAAETATPAVVLGGGAVIISTTETFASTEESQETLGAALGLSDARQDVAPVVAAQVDAERGEEIAGILGDEGGVLLTTAESLAYGAHGGGVFVDAYGNEMSVELPPPPPPEPIRPPESATHISEADITGDQQEDLQAVADQYGLDYGDAYVVEGGGGVHFDDPDFGICVQI